MTIYEHTAIDRTPYTYLIGWSWLDIWYYGVSYRKGCHPTDLWTKYYTSSDHVAVQRWLYGEPDVIQIRRIFNSSKNAQVWEDKCIWRLKMVESPKWLNKKRPKGGWHNKGGYKCPPRTEEWKRKQRESHLGYVRSIESRQRQSDSTRGIPKTQIHRDRIGDAHRGVSRPKGPCSDNRRRAISDALSGVPKSKEHRQALSIAKKGVSIPRRVTLIQKECPHCHKMISSNNYNRFHNDNCKMNPKSI